MKDIPEVNKKLQPIIEALEINQEIKEMDTMQQEQETFQHV